MDKPKKPRLRWRKQPNETGLRRVGQGPRGADLFLDGEEVGSVHAVHHTGRHSHFMWSARADERGIPLRNSAIKNQYYAIDKLDDAKRDCEQYVRECLGLSAKR